MSGGHHRHPTSYPTVATAAYHFSPPTEDVFDSAEAKLHPAHVHTLRSRFLDPIILTFRQMRVHQVPVPVLAVCMCIAFFAGTWVQTAQVLPSPGGPTVRRTVWSAFRHA